MEAGVALHVTDSRGAPVPGSSSLRPLVAALAVLLVPVTAAPAAHAAKAAPRASVTITEPREEVGSGPADLVVSGRATLPAYHTVRLDVSTLGGSVPLTVGARGAWTTTLEDLILGETSICAEVYDSGGGYVTSDCIRYTVLPTPEAFTLTTPTDGAEVEGDVVVGGLCEYGTYVYLTSDTGLESGAECDFATRSWEAPFRDAPAGTHVITATASYGTDTIATRTVTVTVLPEPPATVDITSPEDGAPVLVGQPFTVSGTSNPDAAIRVEVDGVEGGWLVSADAEGTWSAEPSVATSGTHLVCASVVLGGERLAQDCTTVSAAVDPATLSLDSPADGTLTWLPEVEVTGSCFPGTTVVVSAGSVEAGTECSGQYAVVLSGLAEGTQAVTATMYDGATPVTSRSVSITVDTTAPAAPVITAPAPGTTLTTIPVVLTGTAEPGATVEVMTPDELTWVTTTADASGSWTATLERDYFEYAGVLTGRRETLTIRVRATDAAGNNVPPAGYTYRTRLG